MVHRSTRPLRVAAALLLAVAPASAQSAKGKPSAPKPPAKPAAAKPPVVQGTAQLPGDNGKLGTTYTLGKIGTDAVNFTLLKAEYVLGPVTIGETVHVAKEGEKLLLLRYTLHNPAQGPLHAGWETVSMTAVDAQDRNHRWAEVASRAGTTERLDFDLKPAQKVEAVTVIVVPASGPIPKLICQHTEGTPVLRYDLRGVAAVPDPWKDSADASGATLATKIKGAVGTTYATGSWSVAVDKFEKATTPPADVELEDGESVLFAHVTFTNPTTEERTLGWPAVHAIWDDNEGVEIAYNETLLRATRDERVDTAVKPGQSMKARFFVKVPKGAQIKALRLREPEAGRTVVFEIAG
ncbi:MAG: hypothetical protein ACKO5K_06275 [Armatimonadota bacterium]